jgi:hypothetical protein
MRRDGQRIATLQVAFRFRDPLPHVVQLKGPGNADVPREVWLAARRWLNGHDLSEIDPKRRAWDSAPLDREIWTCLWRPYWLARLRIPA